jgi:predicted DNA-binding mobile mystery protein A
VPKVSRDVAIRSRDLIDGRFQEWQPLRELARPSNGWVRAIREALGMSAAYLATRLGTTASAVTRLEQSEAAERIQLDTLRRAADALGCDLVYLLVPRHPLTTVLQERAQELARSQAAAVEQTMRLEDQGTGRESELEAQFTRQLLERGNLWSVASDA